MTRLNSEKFGQVYKIDFPRSGTWRSGETDPHSRYFQPFNQHRQLQISCRALAVFLM
jgi:hypothetical protein